VKTKLGARTWFIGAALLAGAALLVAPAARAQDDVPTASFNIEDAVQDGHSLLPTQNWTPLVRLELAWDSQDAPAPRDLTGMVYYITGDPVDERSWSRYASPETKHLYEFAIIREGQGPDDDGYGVLGDNDSVWYVWDGEGDPVGEVTDLGGALRYEMDFVGDGTEDNPEFPIPNGSADFPASYFLAVRTSALWHNGMHMSVRIPVGGLDWNPRFPDDSATVDEDPFEPETAYSASFGAYDVTGSLTSDQSYVYTNTWNYPNFVYTPQPEYSRPRWDSSATALQILNGEWIQLRRLFAIETWYAVIGLNMHSSSASVMETATRSGFDPLLNPEPRGDVGRVRTVAVDGAYPIEMNVVMTDVGGDPLGPPGNGGFNPQTGLETMTYDVLSAGGDIIVDRAYEEDHAFNGVWLWRDGGNNDFDRPTPGANGATFGEDTPALPMGWAIDDDQNIFMLPDAGLGAYWEHVANPPGGGDPWWRITLQFGNNRGGAGRMEPTPNGDVNARPSIQFHDYFITVRADSGYADASGRSGDGTGITYGAETRMYIEPRYTTPSNDVFDGSMDMGGLLVTSQFPLEWSGGWREHPALSPVNEDTGLRQQEPWWHQRTMDRNNAKLVRFGAEIHDLVMTYESNNAFSMAQGVDIDIAGGDNFGNPAFSDLLDDLGFDFFSIASFARWMDPFGIRSGEFIDGYRTGVVNWRFVDLGIDDSQNGPMQKPYETAPFFNPLDLAPAGPRSFFYPNPPQQPSLPSYATWPLGAGEFANNPGMQTLPPGEFPREINWRPADLGTRKLKQHIDADSRATALLGFNMAGANDPVTNEFAAISLEQITVALWGPDTNNDGVMDFSPADLKALDPEGLSGTSGVAIYVDTGSGTFSDLAGGDQPLPLRSLKWGSAPEFLDVTGDGEPDDLNGDGLITGLDKAWVLRLRPQTAFRVPVEDANIAPFARSLPSGAGSGGGKTVLDLGEEIEGAPYWTQKPRLVDLETYNEDAIAQAGQGMGDGSIPVTQIPGDPDGGGNAGDDLFFVVRTSDAIGQFRKFTALVPATLPERPVQDRTAGMQFAPSNIPAAAYGKNHPEESGGPSFFEHELIEANVAVKLTDLTGQGQMLYANGQPTAVMGIDASTNRGGGAIVASGEAGVGGPGQFTAAGAGFPPGGFVGYHLIDSAYESYLITGNTNTQLTVLSGTPLSGAWRIVRDPTYLEQVIVELYPEVEDVQNFNLLEHLLPLNINQDVSGVALYRDNDMHPDNQNGIFDPGVDIPLQLDYAPYMIGMQGEPRHQVLFVFSSPGTDDVPLQGFPAGLANQPRRRQVIPETFGATLSDPDRGPDFFVVMRAASKVEEPVAFRVGIVSWGPNTPTAPDPDTFPPPPVATVGEFDIFSEFPWGGRGLGFVSFFADIRDYDARDFSGYNWVRTHPNKNVRTNVLTIDEQTAQPGDVVITSVSHDKLPQVTPDGGIVLVIRGSGFGTTPRVTLNNTLLEVQSATDTSISAQIPGGSTFTDMLVLTVTNPKTEKTGTWTAITLVPDDGGFGDAPSIASVSPSSGSAAAFPVTIVGARFSDPIVRFDQAEMPIVEWTPTRVVVAFPSSGLPKTGPLDVTVENGGSGLFATAVDAFTYLNMPGTGVRPCFIATAAYGSPLSGQLDVFRAFRDDVLLKSAAGAAAVDLYYTVSPGFADAVAAHPALAMAVRAALTPIAWALKWPAWAAAVAVGLTLCAAAACLRRRRARAAV